MTIELLNEMFELMKKSILAITWRVCLQVQQLLLRN